jgi:hypothetical protein
MFGGTPWRRMALLAPAFAYGLSHQGLRFTLVWMLFALYVALKTPTGPPPGATNVRT